MRHLKYVIILVLLLSAAGWADPPTGKSEPDPRVTKANEFLESAGGMLAATPPEFQAGALLHLASVEQAAQKKEQALDHLNQAFAASASLPTERDYRVREEVQSMIAALTARLDMERAASMISVIQPAGQGERDQRAVAVESIVRNLAAAKKHSEAIEVLERFAPDGVFAFQAAGELLKGLAPDDDRRTTLCSQAVAAFRQRPDVEPFNIFLRTYRRQIPAPIYETGVRALAQAAMDRKGLPRPLLFSITTPKGTVTVNDPLDSVLFQFIDMVQEIDMGLAQRIADGRPALQAILERYPNGQKSLDATGDSVTTWTDAASADKEGRPTPAQQQRAQVVAMEGKLVQEAMTALRLGEMTKYFNVIHQIPTDRLRQRMIGTAAMHAASKTPEEGKPILSSCVKEMESVKEPASRGTAWITIANAAMKLKDRDLAVSSLDKAIADAKEELKRDADPDHPNLAPKCLWPSAWLLRSAFYRAAAILGTDAGALLDRIPDADLQVMARVEMAASWLEAPASPYYVQVKRK